MYARTAEKRMNGHADLQNAAELREPTDYAKGYDDGYHDGHQTGWLEGGEATLDSHRFEFVVFYTCLIFVAFVGGLLCRSGIDAIVPGFMFSLFE